MSKNVEAVFTDEGGEQGNGHRRGIVWMALLLSVLLLVSGCTPALYNINMRYVATKNILPAVTDGRKYSVTVASFIDQRKMEDTLLIGRVILSDGTAVPILPKYVKPTDATTAALRELLFKTGYPVSPDKPAWNLSENAIRSEWGTILIGGVIEALDVTCIETLMTEQYSAKARVTLVFADVPNKRIFYRVTSESTSSLDHVVFSEGKLESQMNGVLSDALEKAIDTPQTARQIREALKQQQSSAN